VAQPKAAWRLDPLAAVPERRHLVKTKLALAALSLLSLLGAFQVQAQANAANYAYTTTVTGSLTDMSSGTTTLIPADQDDVASAVTFIGFEFFFMGVHQDRFSVNSNGTIRFGATPISTTAYNPLAQAGQSLVTAYGADQRTHAVDGKVHFKVTGSAPNRVLVIEWLNMQADFNTGGTAGLTYQVRLTETTGTIEFVYGSMTMSAAGAADPNSVSPQLGFSSNNAAGTVGSITAAQSGAPAPTFNGASATPVDNVYVAGSIPALTSAANGSRRTFLFTSPVVNPPGGPIVFTGVTATSITLNWTDASNEVAYHIYNSTDGVNFTFVGAAAQNATSFTATGLSGSTNYFWRVFSSTEGSAAFIAGTQASVAPGPNTSLGTGLWSTPGTWSTGAVPTVNDIVTIATGHTVTIDIAAAAYSLSVVSGGILQYEQTTARTLTVGTDVTIDSGGTFRSNPAGTVTTHSLSITGNLVNNGTLDFSTNADTAGAAITFVSANNTSFSGSGITTDVRSINVNKGAAADPILELMTSSFTVRGVTTDTVVGGWLVMTNGTLKISGSFAGTSRVFATAAYTIPASFGFWLNNPNYVVAAQNGSAIIAGRLRITQGTFNEGTLNTATLTASAGAVVTIEGGTVNTSGRFNPSTAFTYIQSGGTFNVATVGNTGSGTGNASFVVPTAAVFNFSGGTINLVQACTGATPVDYINTSASNVALTGTLQAGTAATAANFNFRIRTNIPNLVVDNTTNNKTVTATAQLNLQGTVLVKTGASFVTNGFVVLVIGPTFTNNGTLNGTAAGTRFYFLGNGVPQTYNGSGVVTAPLTSFEVDNPLGVTIDPAVNPIVVTRVNNFSGGITGAGKLTIGNGGATTAVVQLGVTGVTSPVFGFDVPPVFNIGTGGMNLFYAPELTGRTAGNELPPARTLAVLNISNPNDITIAGGDITVNGTSASALVLSGGRVITGPNTLFFNTTVGLLVRTTGHVDGNFRKAVAAASNVTFEVGTANGYTPVSFNITAGTFPTTVTVAAVQTAAPGIQPLTKVITRYWNFTATGITADVTVSYLDPIDIPGTVTEGSLRFFRKGAAGPADYTLQGGTINTLGDTATITGVTQFSPWTLAEPGAELAITKTDGVATATPGGSVTYTVTASNNGPGANPAATVTDNFPGGLTCSTTCAGTLGGTCTAGPFAGNINDSVNVPSGGSVTYTSVCSISPGLAGSLANTASVAGGAVPDSVAGNNSATDTDTLVPDADLSITKTDGVVTATAGGSVTYTITASNAGPSAATGATVADTFPASLTCSWTCAGVGGGTCAAGGAGNINDSATLPAGGSVTYTASCSINPSATGSLSNTATVTAPGGTTDPTPGNNSATDTDTLGASADLGITKTDGVTTATAGGSVTYTITASNAGPSNATSATVADTFPASLTCSWTCAGLAGGTCTAGGAGNLNDSVNLPSGGSVVYTASCTVSAAATGTLSNTATVTAPGGVTDPTPGNNSATDSDTITASADLGITKTDGVTTATPGGSVTYTITASNAGPSNATSSTVADTFPASLTCSWTCAGLAGGTCTAGGAGNINDSVNLPSGGSVTYTASCTISGAATGTLSNTATVTAPGGVTDPTPGNNSATDSDTLGASADLSISKTDGTTTATAGGSTTYTITASNAGPSTATAATVADTFPASLTCSWTCAGLAGGTCTAAGAGNINDSVNLPSGGSVTFTASCTISGAATGSLTNTATVTAPGGVTDPTPGNNSATDIDALGASADLSITKTDGVTTATAGGSVTYTITASNAGPSTATAATVADTFPASLTCSWTCAGLAGGTCTAGGAGNLNDSVNLPSGGSVVYTASCTISGAATGSLSNTATVTAPGSVTDPTPGNNSATDTDTLGASADLAITKTDGVTTATPGGSVTYTITASNAGPSTATGATVADTFPASLTCTWTCAGLAGGTCTAGGAGNINDTANLPSGGSVVYTASCTISGAATGTLSNTATVTAPGGVTDPTPGNNSATDSDTLGASADLSITKTDGTTTATAGGSTTYTITASNAGPSTATAATVADTFPASLTCTWTCAGLAGGTCTAGGAGNINDSVNLPSGGSVTYTASCTISGAATGSLTNTATVTAPGGVTDPTPGNNSATDIDALGASADLAITKTDGVTTATAGTSVTYTITASNAGPSTATGATVADTFPASLTCSWTCAGLAGGTCAAAGAGNINGTVNLPVGGSVTYTASCTISGTATGTLSNTATVTAPGGVTDPTPANNSATDTDTLGASADLSITKTDGTTTVTAGGSTTYTITASNAGPSTATAATVADTFPASLTCSWTCAGLAGGTCTAGGAGNINDAVNLPSGGSVTYTASCTISGAATGTVSNTATVTAPAGVTDPTPGNNSATDSDTIPASAGAMVSGTKTAAGPFTVGSNVTYTIVLTNNGTAAQANNPGNEFTDTLPPQLALVTATASSGAAVANVGTNTVTWNGGIAVSASVTITITATILPAAAGTTVTNQGTISYDSDGNGTNDATAVTDDPAAGGAANGTAFVIAPAVSGEAIPALDPLALLLLTALMAALALAMLKRQ
jgi:uncharacterized repeat protein (TIGR01451 family)